MLPTDQILQGDCTRVLRTLPAASVDLVVTDPPYGVRYRDRLNRTIANDDRPERILGAFDDVYRVLKPDSEISAALTVVGGRLRPSRFLSGAGPASRA